MVRSSEPAREPRRSIQIELLMQVATQLIFHDVARSEWIESYVTERLEKLDRLAGGITSCRLTLTREQSSRHQGNLYSVMVEVRLPPHHDLAARKQHTVKEMSTELPALITQAFAAIERQLKKTAELRRNDEKPHARRARSSARGGSAEWPMSAEEGAADERRRS